MLADLVPLKRGASSIWIDRKFIGQPVVDLISDPDRLFTGKECLIVKDQKKIKVARIPLEVSEGVCRIYVKRYNVFSVRSRLVSLLVQSGAVRALRGAKILKNAGIATAKSVAVVEFRRWGMVSKSFYLTEEIIGGKTADAYWCNDLTPAPGSTGFGRRRRFIKGLALVFQELHRCGVYHNDLKDANIIVTAEKDNESFYLLDIEGVRRYSELSHRRRIKNLVQLYRTLGHFLRRTEKLYFLKIYLGSVFTSGLAKRHWVMQVLSQSRRRDQKKMRLQSPWRHRQIT
ncbi:MAG: hypothetical protein GEU77_04295 [Deltaproteobacteria bacterium]|nr:hypothetical protein [Deltaproteobacteria bacterium]